MPVMTGEEMIEQMQTRAELKGIPTVVVSTEGSQTRIERLQRLGVRFIHKPFSPEAIRDTLKEMLGSEVFHDRSR
jgi:two-component system chemotaxis response regulator CheY